MADDSHEIIITKLEALEQHAQKLLEAAKRNDWREAEAALISTQTCLFDVTRFVQLANDIQRGQIR
jgi:hypothetical protein